MHHHVATDPLRRSAAVLAMLAVAGCVVGPNFQTPPALAVNSYIANQRAATTGSGTGAAAAQAFHPGVQLPQAW